MKNFRQLKQFLEENFPELNGRVQGELYAPPSYAVLLERIVSSVQIFAMLCIFLGDSVWNMVPFVQGPPEFYFQLKQNPMAGIGLVFFVLPSVARSIGTTGAFEVIVDDVVIFSKLEQGRMPSAVDVLDGLSKVGLTRTH